MPTHPETGIVYDEGVGNSRFVVVRHGDDARPIAVGVSWPRHDGGPVVDGLPAGEEWFRLIDTPQRDYDYRYVVVDTIGPTRADNPPPGYPSGTWGLLRTARLRTVDELHQVIRDRLNETNRALSPATANPVRDDLVQRAEAARSADRATAAQLALLQEEAALRIKRDANLETAYAMMLAASAGQEFDLDAGWSLP